MRKRGSMRGTPRPPKEPVEDDEISSIVSESDDDSGEGEDGEDESLHRLDSTASRAIEPSGHRTIELSELSTQVLDRIGLSASRRSQVQVRTNVLVGSRAGSGSRNGGSNRIRILGRLTV
eukprot:9471890-Pyramimonas_sp.AAC.1